MPISRYELLNLQETKTVAVEIEDETFSNNPFIRRWQDVVAEVTIHPELAGVTVDIAAQGVMICPCALTSADIKYPFTVKQQAKLVFKEGEDGYYVAQALDLKELVRSFILAEVPIKLVKSTDLVYPKGDGWEVMTEEAYERSRATRSDPRWQKLKDYQFDEEE